jgi:hypothetical protein
MIPFAALLSIGEKVLDKVMPDPEAKAKAQAMLMEMAQKGQLAELEANVRKCSLPVIGRFRLPRASLLPCLVR